MRIEQLAIEGFGKLHQQELDLTSPVTVLLGPNEAGKSTAASFIRTMLYGFPQRRSGIERYEPLAGGRHGGRLKLITDRQQRLTIERFDIRDGLRIWDEHGSIWSESELHRAIGGYQGELFRRMFAFSLSELQEVRLLESEDVGRYLYMVGLGRGGGKSILEAERRLSTEMERLFKHRGSVQLIPQKAREVEELEAKLQAARGQSEAYNALLDQLQACEQAIQTAEEEARHLLAQLNWLDACVEAREDWIAYREMEERLADLPNLDNALPDDAVDRLDQWRERTERLSEEEQRTRRAWEQARAERATLALLEDRDELRQRLEPLLERLASAIEDVDRLRETELELDALEEAVARSVRAISPDWTVDQLRAYPMSQAEVEQVRVFRDTQGRLQAAADRLDAERREREDRLQVERSAWKEADNGRQRLLEERQRYPELAPLPYAERVRLIRQFLREAVRWSELEREARHVQDRLADARRVQQWTQEMPGRSSRRKREPQVSWTTPLTLAGMSGAAAGLAGFAALGEWGWAATAVGMGGLLIVVPRLSSWLNRGRQRAEAVPPQHPEPIEEELAERLHQQWLLCEQQRKQAASSCRERLVQLLSAGALTAAARESQGHAAFAEEDAGVAMASGKPENASPLADESMDIAAWREQLEELLPLEERLELYEEQLQERARLMERAQEELERTQARLADNKAAAAVEQERWEEWLARRDLARESSPEAVHALLQTIEKGQAIADQAEHRVKQLSLLRSRMTAFNAAVRSLCADFPSWLDGEQAGYSNAPAVLPESALSESEWPEAAPIAWTSCLKALQRMLRKQEELARRAEVLEQQGADLREALVSLEASEAHIAQERDQLLREAGVKEESELRRRAELEAERRRCVEQRAHLTHVLQVRLGGKPITELAAVWQAHTLPEVLTKREQLERRLHECSQEQQGLVDRKVRLQLERDRLIRDEEYSALLQAFKEAKSELKELAAQWTVRAMAQEWFRMARETYEQERQPAVMQQASARFSQMTGGAYSRVYTTIGEGKLEVEHAQGTRLDPGQLSRGTREQLLLAIRFALAEETADRVVMPLLMDDVFVNFDPVRLERCWDIVHDMSKRHQIVYFTCHPHIAEMAQRRNSAVQVIHL